VRESFQRTRILNLRFCLKSLLSKALCTSCLCDGLTTMIHYLRAPQNNPNDEEVIVAHWEKEERSLVNQGDVIAILETTKSTFDFESPESGYLIPLVEARKTVAIGAVIAAITDDVNAQVAIPDESAVVNESKDANDERRWTKKAELLATKHGVDL